MKTAKSREVKDLFQNGIGIHHAGLMRSDRNLIERMFSAGHIRVLICTATLAWGVNLPAHAVIIRGTEIYDPQKGAFCDIGILDVQQIFGRAGRPQYETFGIILSFLWYRILKDIFFKPLYYKSYRNKHINKFF